MSLEDLPILEEGKMPVSDRRSFFVSEKAYFKLVRGIREDVLAYVFGISKVKNDTSFFIREVISDEGKAQLRVENGFTTEVSKGKKLLIYIPFFEPFMDNYTVQDEKSLIHISSKRFACVGYRSAPLNDVKEYTTLEKYPEPRLIKISSGVPGY